VLDEPLVGAREAHIGPRLVVREEDPYPLLAHFQRDVETARGAEAARDLLQDLLVVEHGVDAFAAPALEHARDLRLARQHRVQQRLGILARDSLDPEVPTRNRKGDGDDASVDEVAEALGDELEKRWQVELAGQGRSDLLERLHLP